MFSFLSVLFLVATLAQFSTLDVVVLVYVMQVDEMVS
jgi:hypothetical protein